MQQTSARLAALALGAFSALPTGAGPQVWTGGGPEGGTVYAIARDPSNAGRYYIGTVNGVFRSDDEGATWNRMAAGANRTIQDVAVANDGLVYALAIGENGGLFVSSDGGTSWTQLTTPAGHLSFVAVAPTNSARVVLGVGGATVVEVHLSIDGGASFDDVATGLPGFPREIAFDPTDEQIAYCAAADGVFRSLDGGATWNVTGGGQNTSQIAVAPSAPLTLLATGSGRVTVSSDGGTSWNEDTTARGSRDATIAPSNALHMAALHNGSLYLTTDGGASWGSPITATGWGATHGVQYHASEVTRLLVGARYGVSSTADGGDNWSDSSTGINAYYQWTRIAPSSSTVAFERGARLKTLDAGATWISGSTGLPQSSGLSMDIDASDPSHAVWLGSSSLFETTDGGDRWTDVTPAVFDVFSPTSIDLDPYDPQRWILGNSVIPFERIEPALAISEDGGSTWETGLGVDSEDWFFFHPWRVAFHPADSDVLLATGAGLDLDSLNRCWTQRSVDGGATWTAGLDLDVAAFCFSDVIIDPTDGQRAYVLTNVRDDWSLRRSPDGGQTWEVMTLPFGRPLAIEVDPANGDLYVGSDLLYRSSDGGTTWTGFPTTGLSDQVRFVGWVEISSTTPPTFWISTNAGIFTYTGSPDIFADGFESGNTSAWSATVP